MKIANKASDHRILTKGRITEGADFSPGQGNETLTTRKHCSRLQQSRYRAVMEYWIIPMHFQGRTTPKIATSHGGILIPYNTWFLHISATVEPVGMKFGKVSPTDPFNPTVY